MEKDFITKKIKYPKGYKASELIGNDNSGVIVFDKKRRKKNEKIIRKDRQKVRKKID